MYSYNNSYSTGNRGRHHKKRHRLDVAGRARKKLTELINLTKVMGPAIKIN